MPKSFRLFGVFLLWSYFKEKEHPFLYQDAHIFLALNLYDYYCSLSPEQLVVTIVPSNLEVTSAL
jgi:hypothetical protein